MIKLSKNFLIWSSNFPSPFIFRLHRFIGKPDFFVNIYEMKEDGCSIYGTIQLGGAVHHPTPTSLIPSPLHSLKPIRQPFSDEKHFPRWTGTDSPFGLAQTAVWASCVTPMPNAPQFSRRCSSQFRQVARSFPATVLSFIPPICSPIARLIQFST